MNVRRRFSRRDILPALQAVTGLVAVLAVILWLTNLHEVQASRHEAAFNSCQLLRGLVLAATTNAPAQRRASQAYINRTPLRDCNAYAARVTNGTPITQKKRK